MSAPYYEREDFPGPDVQTVVTDADLLVDNNYGRLQLGAEGGARLRHQHRE